MRMNLFISYLKSELNKRYPEVEFGLYLSKRKKFIWVCQCCFLIMLTVRKLLPIFEGMWLSKKDVDFYFVKPKLIHITKWKYDYTIFEKNC